MNTALSELRAALRQHNLNGFILPVNDDFMGEYIPDSAKRLEWLTGFTGSAGSAVILTDKAGFFTDGRYTLQAAAEVKGFELYNSGDVSPEKWIGQQASRGGVIGYDPKLHTLNALRRFGKHAPSVTWKPITPNPVDALWKNRPAPPSGPARPHPLQYAGESWKEKCARMAEKLSDKNAEAMILTAPDSICWLLNMRGSDVPYTPFLLCYAVLKKNGDVILYADASRIPQSLKDEWKDNVMLHSVEQIEPDMKVLSGQRVLYDAANSPVWFYQLLTRSGCVIEEESDPCQLAKACKNEVELQGMREAHIRDGLAETRFLYWLDQADISGFTEMDVAAKLEALRQESPLYLEPSFTTISGSGPNGAIVHYRATPATNRILDKNSLLLLDSGGQYADGTTDITRTIAIGVPTAEMKDRFTRVLKGHIALARAVFPYGTTGSQLDALARQYLWEIGCDYDHGTGHGVGSYLSVHEGPQRISKRGGDTPLEAGMILSNEPGYYKTGEYGIRIENLVMVKDVSTNRAGRRFLGFETITLVPLDMRCVEKSLLNQEESNWLVQYRHRVVKAHASNLTANEAAWLTKTIGN